MACGISLQKLSVHDWGVVNSLVGYIFSVAAAPFCPAASVERDERREQALSLFKVCGPLGWFVACVDGCIELAPTILFAQTSYR